jgi:atypical dual specificity phosphatase
VTALELRGFGVAFADRIILSNVSCRLPRVGMTVLVGPAGGGKSTLLRTLAGLNDGHPSLVTWGEVTYGASAAPLAAEAPRPALVMQHAKFFLDTVRENLVSALPNRSALEAREQTRVVAERLRANELGELASQMERNALELDLPLQRRLATARALMGDPAVLFVDEPTAGLGERDAADFVAMLRQNAARRSIVLVTHDQAAARAAGGTTLLLAEGRIQESAPTSAFFSSPATEHARQFVRTGGCVRPAEVPVEVADQPTAPSPLIVPMALAKPPGPRGFFWVIPGHLGGMPRPGIIDDLDEDLDGLRRLGVTVLVTLEERRFVDPTAVALHGMEPVHFPIPDMGAPAVGPTLALCRRIERLLRDGEVVAVHCRAGLGRTGTILACQLIIAGKTACEALESVRAVNPRCVQSSAQVSFLGQLAAARDAEAAPAPPSERSLSR